MNTQHTPGPWVVDSTEYVDVIAPAGRIAMLDGDSLTDYCEANARLIAAAPELLLHLQRLVRAIDRAPANFADGLADEARAAISRATGANA